MTKTIIKKLIFLAVFFTLFYIGMRLGLVSVFAFYKEIAPLPMLFFKPHPLLIVFFYFSLLIISIVGMYLLMQKSGLFKIEYFNKGHFLVNLIYPLGSGFVSSIAYVCLLQIVSIGYSLS